MSKPWGWCWHALAHTARHCIGLVGWSRPVGLYADGEMVRDYSPRCRPSSSRVGDCRTTNLGRATAPKPAPERRWLRRPPVGIASKVQVLRRASPRSERSLVHEDIVSLPERSDEVSGSSETMSSFSERTAMAAPSTATPFRAVALSGDCVLDFGDTCRSASVPPSKELDRGPQKAPEVSIPQSLRDGVR